MPPKRNKSQKNTKTNQPQQRASRSQTKSIAQSSQHQVELPKVFAQPKVEKKPLLKDQNLTRSVSVSINQTHKEDIQQLKKSLTTSLQQINEKQEISKKKSIDSQSKAQIDLFANQIDEVQSVSAKQSKRRVTRSQSRPVIKQQTKPSTQINLVKPAQNENEMKVVFKEGTLIAYLDREAVAQNKILIHIGKILQNTTTSERKVNLIQFESGDEPESAGIEIKSDLSVIFNQRNQEPQTIKDYQIICVVEAQKSSKKSVNPLSITITKKTAMEANKLVNNIFDSVIQKINDEEDAAAEAEAEAEEQKSLDIEESDEDYVEPGTKAPKRVILRGKRNINSGSILTQEVQTRKSVSKKKIGQDLEGIDDEMEKVEVKKQKIGVKRQYPSSIKKISATQNVRKVKKLAEGTGELVEKKVKAPPKPKRAKKEVPVFKLGKYNNNTVLLTEADEIQRSSPDSNPIYDCCIRCNSRNVIRAVETDNIPLLLKVIQDIQNVPSITEPWSIDSSQINPFQIIFEKGKKDMLEKILKVPIKDLANSAQTSTDASNLFVSQRVRVPQTLLEKIDTGMVSEKAYGYAVRAVQMTRGNRQGNQAFLIQNVCPKNPFNIKHEEYFNKFVTVELYKLYTLLTNLPIPDATQIMQFALQGNLDMLKMIIEPLIKHDHYGFNNLHLEVLSLTQITEKVNTTSITKKSASNFITPLHLACLNPNKPVIQALIDQNNDLNVQDSENNKPIHYAAICSSNGPLEVLIAKSANVNDLNNHKQTPLHLAGLNSRALNVKTILENNILGIKLRDKKENKTAFAYALEQGDLETIKAFLDYSQGKIKINTGQGYDRMSPLMYASTQGRYDLALYLLEHRKARVLSKDKFKRTALIMAVRNGHLRIASLLLKHGSDWNHKDSSDNTPLHYAAGSGFIECIELLITHGAEINAANMWKVTPITIAMMNNHHGVVKRLLQEPNVDINGKDEKGLTLLLMALMSIDVGGDFNFVKFLIEKGADINMADIQKTAPLHLLIEKAKIGQLLYNKNYFEFFQYLLEKGADVNAKNGASQTPINLLLSLFTFNEKTEGNYFKDILFLLIEKGANINIQGDTIVHQLIQKITSKQIIENTMFIEIVEHLVEKGADLQTKNRNSESVIFVMIQKASDFQIFTNQNFVQLLKFFIEKGANVNDSNLSGQSPIIILIKHFYQILKLQQQNNNSYNNNYSSYNNYNQQQVQKKNFADVITDNLNLLHKNLNDNVNEILTKEILPKIEIQETMLKLCQLLVQNGANLDVNESNNPNAIPLLHMIIQAQLQLQQNEDQQFVANLLQRKYQIFQQDQSNLVYQKQREGIYTTKHYDYADEQKYKQQQTEIIKSLYKFKEKILQDFTFYIVEQNINVNCVDSNWNTCLHILPEQKQVHLISTVNTLCDMLLSKNADLSLQNKNHKTPFEIALDKDNVELLQKFISSAKLSKDPNIQHSFAPKIIDNRYRSLIVQMLEIDRENLTLEIMNVLDNIGLSPLLSYVRYFIQMINSQATVKDKIQQFLYFKLFQLKQAGDLVDVQNNLPKNVTNQIVQSFQISTEQDYNKYQDEIRKNSQWYLNYISNYELNQIISQLYEQQYFLPFIEFLRTIVILGANPKQKVDKIKFYRELDVYMMMLNQSSDQKVEDLLISTIVKKHESDKISELEKQQYLKEYQIQVDEIKLLKREQKVQKLRNLFYQKHSHRAQFIQRNGKNLEVEYDQQLGLQNVIHFIFKQEPNEVLYRLFADEYGVEVDQLDFLNRTPFHINILAFTTRREMFDQTKDLVYQKKIRFELPFFESGATAFLHVYLNGNIQLADTFLKHGANINHVDFKGNFALKQSLKLKDNEEICDEIKRLISLGADINLTDNKGRNVLHHAVNNSSATADASFESEQLLIDYGININKRDNAGRVPLHYAFVKIKNRCLATQIDPIETVSSLCGYPQLEIEVADKWNKTPLHYAAQRSSVICTLYILQRGAQLESKDVFGNTALAVSIFRKHFSFAILLIQKFANVKTPIFEEVPEIIKQKWALEKKIALNQDQDDEMDGKESAEQKRLDELNKSFQTRISTSSFRRAIQNDQQGLAYLILDNGYDYMLAMQDSLDDKKFKLVLTLLSKTSDSKIVQRKNENQQNLMHILAKNSQGGQVRVFQRIYDNLKRHGVNCLEKDGFGSTALHYSVTCGCLELSQVLVKEGVDVNVINNDGHSALTQLVKGDRGIDMEFYTNGLFQLLIKNGADLNLIYPESGFSSYICKICTQESTYPQSKCPSCNTKLSDFPYAEIKDYKCPIIINTVRRHSNNQHLKRNIQCLLDNGASLNILDSINRDAMIYATINQNALLVQQLINNSSKGLLIKHKDFLGYEAENYLVNSKNLGSRNSIETILQLLKMPNLITLSPVDYSGKDLLMHAAILNNKELTEIFTRNYNCGLRKNHIDNQGNTVLNHMMISGRLGNKENLQILELILGIKDLISLSSVDKKGRDALIHGIKQNNLELVNILINNYEQNLIKNHSNLKGNTVVHFLMKSKSLGSEINLRILTKILSQSNIVKLSAVDVQGRDLLMLAIKQNNFKFVKLLIQNANQDLLQNHQDIEGKTALHYVVNPVPYGSYENTEILDLILSSGLHYDLNTVDKYGQTPLFYALQQNSGVLAKFIVQALKIDNIQFQQNHYLPYDKWQLNYNFNSDAESLIQEAKILKAEKLQDDTNYVALDQAFADGKQFSVYFHNKRPYDAYLTKVDLQNGIHGEFNFYKIQMVYDSNRELYIVLTRYGRIGEEGMHQRTPFNSVDEAMKEFQSIFKKKTSNDWLTSLETFEKHPKKYSLVLTDYTNVKHDELLLPFDYKNSPKSSLSKYEKKILKLFSDVAVQRRIIQSMGINIRRLPLSKITSETIDKAHKILNDLEIVIKDFITLRTKSFVDTDIAANYDATRELYNKMQELTSKFYQLIPMNNIVYWEVKPITDLDQLKKIQQKIHQLTEIEYCSRILLAALYQQKNVNPVDYILNSIQVQFKQVQDDNPEFKLIKNYINSSAGRNLYHLKLFKVQRRGEGEKFSKFESFKNRNLLFHGTSTANMLGILSKGLMIAPPEAQTTGHAFGKGLYFADKFSKSQNYCQSDNPRKKVMLLCEVALGNPLKMYTRTYISNLPEGYDSLQAVGSLSTDFSSNTTVTTPEGFQVAQEGPVSTKVPTEQEFTDSELHGNNYPWKNIYNELYKQFNWQISDNEFIVFNTDQVKIHYVIQWSDSDYKAQDSSDYQQSESVVQDLKNNSPNEDQDMSESQASESEQDSDY